MVFSGDLHGRGFLSLDTKKGVPGAAFKGIKKVRGAPPVLKIKVVMSKVVLVAFQGNLEMLPSNSEALFERGGGVLPFWRRKSTK